MPQSIHEQLETTKKELQQTENRLKILENRKHDVERRERTHRLIERGAMLESLVYGSGGSRPFGELRAGERGNPANSQCYIGISVP